MSTYQADQLSTHYASDYDVAYSRKIATGKLRQDAATPASSRREASPSKLPKRLESYDGVGAKADAGVNSKKTMLAIAKNMAGFGRPNPRAFPGRGLFNKKEAEPGRDKRPTGHKELSLQDAYLVI